MLLNHKFGWRDIEGWFNFGRLYDRIIREAKPGDQIVEVGTWFGKSTCYLASRAKLSGKQLKIFAVDTFKGSATESYHQDTVQRYGGSIYGQFIQNMTKAGVIDTLTVLPIESTVAAHNFLDDSLFAVFIDGAHVYEEVLKDLKAWHPKVKKGGILAGHDYSYQSVKDAVRDFGLKVEVYPGDANDWESWVHNK